MTVCCTFYVFSSDQVLDFEKKRSNRKKIIIIIKIGMTAFDSKTGALIKRNKLLLMIKTEIRPKKPRILKKI